MIVGLDALPVALPAVSKYWNDEKRTYVSTAGKMYFVVWVCVYRSCGGLILQVADGTD